MRLAASPQVLGLANGLQVRWVAAELVGAEVVCDQPLRHWSMRELIGDTMSQGTLAGHVLDVDHAVAVWPTLGRPKPALLGLALSDVRPEALGERTRGASLASVGRQEHQGIAVARPSLRVDRARNGPG